MTKAKASSVAGDLVTNGYDANATQSGDGTWEVVGKSKDGPVDSSAVAAFAAAHGVSAKLTQVTFS